MVSSFEDNSAPFFGLSWRQANVVFFVLAFCFLYLHLFIFPATPIYYENRPRWLLNDAKRMVEGEIIYRDFFEFVFPGSHTLYALFIAIFGPKYWIANFLDSSSWPCLDRHLRSVQQVSFRPDILFISSGRNHTCISGFDGWESTVSIECSVLFSPASQCWFC